MNESNSPVLTKAAKLRDSDGLHKRRGVWHFKIKVAGRWREVSTRTTNYAEAKQKRQEQLRALEDGRLPTDIAKWPFQKFEVQWLEGRKKLVAPQTYRIDKERLVALRKFFGGHRLCDITATDIRVYQLKRIGQVSPRTINLETKVLRMILRSVKLWARIADDYKPLKENKRGPGRALTPDEENRLFTAAGGNPDWLVVYCAAQIAANTTMRGCELRGLRLADIDLLARTVTIRRTGTKTDAGCRVIPLNKTAMWAFARVLERAKLLGSTESDHYAFPAFKYRHTKEGNVKGTGYDVTKPMKTWRTAWRSLTKQAGLPGLRFHDLRHHAITRLAEAGVPEQTLMAIAGHVSKEMLEHYSHIRMQAKREAVAALDSLKPQEPEQHPAPVSVN